MNEDEIPKQVKPTSSIRRAILHAALLLVAFLFGFVPMGLKYRECSGRLARAEHQSSIGRIENGLASAAIDARRGAYEPARQAASDFFTSLQAEIDSGDDSAFSQAQREGLQPAFSGRDEIITLLARSEPASADRLSDLYVSYRKIMNR
jgi:hypothetical protein